MIAIDKQDIQFIVFRNGFHFVLCCGMMGIGLIQMKSLLLFDKVLIKSDFQSRIATSVRIKRQICADEAGIIGGNKGQQK